MKVLVAGGAGYVGSSICQALIEAGHVPVILDLLLSGRDYFIKDKIFYKGDIGDQATLNTIFSDHEDIGFAIHCAEKAVVDTSVFNPYEYYSANVVKSIDLFKHLSAHGCNNIIFCSSASIYEDVAGYMVTETSPIHPRSPFARTKYIVEMMLQDFCLAYGMRSITLRYFNPVGAAPDMSTGLEDSNATNIVSKLINAVYEDKEFVINGTDWGTRDGTCIRDYVHVWDVALAHVKAVENFEQAFQLAGEEKHGYLPINIGSGVGVTVRELIAAFENITSEKVKVGFGQRRPGDISGSYANTNLARKMINWECTLTTEEAILDAIRWTDKRKAEMFNN